MKNLATLIVCLGLLQGCITNTQTGDDVKQPMEQPMGPTGPDTPDDPTPEGDPPVIDDPVEVPTVDPQPPAGRLVSASVIGLALDLDATEGHRRLEDGRLFVEASSPIVLQVAISLPSQVGTDGGWVCRTTLGAVNQRRTGTEIHVTAQTTLRDCQLDSDTPSTTLEHTRRIELTGIEPGAYSVTADGAVDNPSIELSFNVVAGGELPMSCAVCDQCGEGRDECVRTCRGISDAMEFEYAQSWWACMQERVCEPDQARACLDTLSCQVDQVVAGHCDVLARCANDGRGWLDEAACREEPYYEARVWSCLRPERRSALTDCMSAQTCDNLEFCLSNAACQGDMGCLGAMSTRLAVDCHGICDRSNPGANCSFNQNLTGCYQRCDQAAFRLNDAARREMESCARDEANIPACQESRARTVVEYCVGQLSCESDMLNDGFAAARARCPEAATATVAVKMPALECLGHVIETNVYTCLTETACADLEQCVTDASCGDDEGCLAFATLRFTEE